MPNCRRRFATESEVKKHIDNHMNPNTNKSRRGQQANHNQNQVSAAASAAAAAAAVAVVSQALSSTVNQQQTNTVDNGGLNGISVVSVPLGDIKPPTGTFHMPLMDQQHQQQQQQHQHKPLSPQHHLLPRMGPTGTAIVKHELYFPQCYAPPFQQAYGQQPLVQTGSNVDGSALNVGPSVTPSMPVSTVPPQPTIVQ